jgi:maltodextrin utilization protein YvdJ
VLTFVLGVLTGVIAGMAALLLWMAKGVRL